MAKKKLTKEETYLEISPDIEEFFQKRLENFCIPVEFKFQLQINLNQKQLIKISKIPDNYSILLKKDLMISINSEYFDSFNSRDAKTNEILFDQCIDLINYDMNDGTVKIGKENFTATIGIIEKYTYANVQEAKEMEKLFQEQLKDKK